MQDRTLLSLHDGRDSTTAVTIPGEYLVFLRQDLPDILEIRLNKMQRHRYCLLIPVPKVRIHLQEKLQKVGAPSDWMMKGLVSQACYWVQTSYLQRWGSSKGFHSVLLGYDGQINIVHIEGAQLDVVIGISILQWSAKSSYETYPPPYTVNILFFFFSATPSPYLLLSPQYSPFPAQNVLRLLFLHIPFPLLVCLSSIPLSTRYRVLF